MHNKITTPELLEEINRLADELGRPPRSTEMDDYGKYSYSTYKNRFGSWEKAVRIAGFDYKSPNNNVSNQELIDDVLAANAVIGRPPTCNEMRDYGNYSHITYIRRFGSWKDAIEAAGLEYRETKIDDNDILQDVKKVSEKIGGRPSVVDYRKHGEYSVTAVRKRFGDWHEVLREIA